MSSLREYAQQSGEVCRLIIKGFSSGRDTAPLLFDFLPVQERELPYQRENTSCRSQTVSGEYQFCRELSERASCWHLAALGKGATTPVSWGICMQFLLPEHLSTFSKCHELLRPFSRQSSLSLFHKWATNLQPCWSDILPPQDSIIPFFFFFLLTELYSWGFGAYHVAGA